MVKENDAWKISKYVTAEEEFAASVSAVKTAAEAGALLNTQPELVTPDLARALTTQARELLARGKQAEALTINDLALSIAQRLNDKTGMFLALRVKAQVSRMRGDYKQALEYLEECLKLAQELGDKANIANALNSLAIIYAYQSDLPNALTMFQRSLQIKEELGDKLDIARELSNIGNIYMSQGEKVRALDHFERSFKLADELGNKAGASATLNSIGALYHSQGNYALALEYYQRSLKIKQEIGDKLGVARALSNIGTIYSVQGQYTQALDYLQQNYKIREELGDKAGEVEALHYIGAAYLLKGDYSEALAYEQRALKPAEALASNELLGEILENISECHLRMGQYQTANEYAERAASLAVRLGTPEILWKARNLAGKARLALNQPELARADFLESIATIEKLRGRVAGGETEQQHFFENKIAPYQAMVQLLLAGNNPAEALSYAERAKGRVLLDVLNRGRDDVTKGMTSEELKRDGALSSEIASLNTELVRLKSQGKPNEAQIAAVQIRLDKMRLEYEAFQASLYVAHPELKVQRGQTRMLTLDEAAALLPDDRTAILEYVVTEDKSYLFVLRKAAVTRKPDLTVYTLNIKSSELAAMADSFRQRVAERDLAVKRPARQLYDLLIRPAAKQLAGVRKLCIVPDGALWNVPFQALHAEKAYLLEQYAVFYAPSLSVLREMGRRAHALASRQTVPSASPVSLTADSRNARAGLLAMGNPALSGETAARARFARRDEPLSPLPDAEKEVNSLGRLYGADNSKVLTGEDAREAVVKAEAGRYEVLHFATHATLDDQNPLYSRIILSRTETDVHEDGLLEAWEIMKLDLNASLTVLSACETARGRVVAGEGIIGISWALFVAGSPAAVVSQWKVDSARTSELMIEFHRNWLRKRDATKSEALRQAALKLLRGPYNHPAYWAGFVLIGDDN
jgi:CHAT domain-containing protein/tetratricopeptide (TPR) repeat protein